MAKDYLVYTVEHKCYKVTGAKTLREAKEIVKSGDLAPKDNRLSIDTMGDFEIVA